MNNGSSPYVPTSKESVLFLVAYFSDSNTAYNFLWDGDGMPLQEWHNACGIVRISSIYRDVPGRFVGLDCSELYRDNTGSLQLVTLTTKPVLL